MSVAALESSRACLRIFGDDLVPDEISALLGSAPTKSETRGEVLRSANGRERVAKSGGWRLEATDTAPEDTDAQVRQLLSTLSPDLGVWRGISARYEVDLFCGWFMTGSNDGASLAPETLLALGERGIALSLDIYASTPDE